MRQKSAKPDNTAADSGGTNAQASGSQQGPPLYAPPTEPANPVKPILQPGQRFSDQAIEFLSSGTGAYLLDGKKFDASAPNEAVLQHLGNSSDPVLRELSAMVQGLLNNAAQSQRENAEMQEAMQKAGSQMTGSVLGGAINMFMNSQDVYDPDTDTVYTVTPQVPMQQMAAEMANAGRPLQMKEGDLMELQAEGTVLVDKTAGEMKLLARQGGAAPSGAPLSIQLDSNPKLLGLTLVTNNSGKTLHHCLILTHADMDADRIMADERNNDATNNLFKGMELGMGIPQDFLQNAQDLQTFQKQLACLPANAYVYLPTFQPNQRLSIPQFSPDKTAVVKRATVSIWSDETAMEDTEVPNLGNIQLLVPGPTTPTAMGQGQKITLPANADPATIFLTALRDGNFDQVFDSTPSYRAKLAAVDPNNPQAKLDAMDAAKKDFSNDHNTFGPLQMLVSGDCAFHVIDAESSGAAVLERVQIDYKNGSDSPIVRAGSIKQATVELHFRVASRSAGTPGEPWFALQDTPTWIRQSDVLWPKDPPRIIACSSPAMNMFVSTRGGKPPFRIALFSDDQIVCTALSWIPFDQQNVFLDHTIGNKHGYRAQLLLMDADGNADAGGMQFHRSNPGPFSFDDINWMTSPLFRQNNWRDVVADSNPNLLYSSFSPMEMTRIDQSKIAEMVAKLKEKIAAAQARRVSLSQTASPTVIEYKFLAYPGTWSEPICVPDGCFRKDFVCANDSAVEMRCASYDISISSESPPQHQPTFYAGNPQTYSRDQDQVARGHSNHSRFYNDLRDDALFFKSTSGKPELVGVRFVMHNLSAGHLGSPFAMRDLSRDIRPDDLPREAKRAKEALAAYLQNHSQFQGHFLPRGADPNDPEDALPVDALLVWDQQSEFVMGWIKYDSAVENVWGRIYYDGLNPPYLCLHESARPSQFPRVFAIQLSSTDGAGQLSGRGYTGSAVKASDPSPMGTLTLQPK